MPFRFAAKRIRERFSRRHLTLLGTVVVLVGGTLVVVRTLDTGAVIAALRGADPLLLAVAVLVYTASWPVRGKRFADILGGIGYRIGITFLTMAIFLSQTANLVFPARAGDGGRAYLVKARRDVHYASGAAALTVERLFDLLAITILGAAALLWLVLAGHSPTISGRTGRLATAVAVGSVAVVAFVVILSRRDWGPGRSVRAAVNARIDNPLVARLAGGIEDFGEKLQLAASQPRLLVVICAESLGIWALDVATAVLVFAALGTGLDPLVLVLVGTLAVSVGNLAKVVPLSQGGIGLYEAGFTAIVVSVTPVAPALALAAALLDHALKNSVTLIGGGLSAVWLNVRPSHVTAEG